MSKQENELTELRKLLAETEQKIKKLENDKYETFLNGFKSTSDPDILTNMSDVELRQVGRVFGELFNQRCVSSVVPESEPEVPLPVITETDVVTAIIPNEQEQNGQVSTPLTNTKPKYIRRSAKGLPELTTEQNTWASRMRTMIHDFTYRPDTTDTFNSLLRKIYRKMTNTYGIVWEQCKKDFKEMHCIDDGVVISNFRLVCSDKNLRSIFECLLKDYLEGSSDICDK